MSKGAGLVAPQFGVVKQKRIRLLDSVNVYVLALAFLAATERGSSWSKVS
jgi:hypothetical protein